MLHPLAEEGKVAYSHCSCFELPGVSPDGEQSGEQDCWVSGSFAPLKWQKAAGADLRTKLHSSFHLAC